MNKTRSQKWDRQAVPFLGLHAQLSKRTKEKHFRGPFLGPCGGTKNETAKSQNQQQMPTRATNKKLQLRYLKLPIISLMLHYRSTGIPLSSPADNSANDHLKKTAMHLPQLC